jgi:transcription antitermination factor NusG
MQEVIAATSNIPVADDPMFAVPVFDEPRWYAVYTCANREKRVAEQFTERSIEHFLPLYETVRQWKDRRVRVQSPLFPGYIFVNHILRKRLQILSVSGVVRLVGFNSIAAALPPREIESLREGLRRPVRAEPHPYLTTGERVQILRGPFEGFQGILQRRRGQLRVVLSIDLIKRSMAVEVGIEDIRPELR